MTPAEAVAAIRKLHRPDGFQDPDCSFCKEQWPCLHLRHVDAFDSLADATVERLRQHIAALPEQAATRSRDFGRGYAQAIRDVLNLMEAP